MNGQQYGAPMPPNGTRNIIKTFKVVNPNNFRRKCLEIQNEHMQPILYNVIHRQLLSRPVITLQRTPDKGAPALATAEEKAFSNSFSFTVGQSSNTANSSGFGGTKYDFNWQGRVYCWKRTHDKELGGHTMGTGSWKLVDGDRVLMVYLRHRSMINHHEVAAIDFYEQLDQGLELAALITILTVQDRLQRRRQNGTVAAAAAS